MGWVIGYLSGLNLMLAAKDAQAKDHLISASPNQIYFWIDNYCKQNPLKTVYRAANDLFIEMGK